MPRHLTRAVVPVVLLALAGCASGRDDSQAAPTSAVTSTTPTSSAASAPSTTMAPTSTTTTRPTTTRPTTRAPSPSVTRAAPPRVAPATPTSPRSTTQATAPSLRGDTRNSWAFASLQGGDIVVEGSVASHKAWSTSKVLVVAAFVQTVADGNPERLTSAQRSLVTRALSASDMDALVSLRSQIPGSKGAVMTSILRSVGDTRTVATDTNQGGMQWAPADQVRFLRGLWRGAVVSRATSAYLMEELDPIAAHEWGLGTIGATHFKGGWYRADTVTRQMGFHRGFAVVIITDAVGPAVRQSDGDVAHVQQMNLLAARLNQRLALRPGP